MIEVASDCIAHAGCQQSVVVSLRIYKGPAAIDRDRGILFDHLDCAVYRGRQLLGRYSRIGVRRIAAFDTSGLWLGDYRKPRLARIAICNRWKISKPSIEVEVQPNGSEPQLAQGRATDATAVAAQRRGGGQKFEP
jgi:hypothetical protein